MELTTENLRLTRLVVNKLFQEGQESLDVETLDGYMDFTSKVMSSSAQEIYAWLKALRGMREWIGNRQFQRLKETDWRLKNRDWENSLAVDANSFDDKTFGQYSDAFRAFGKTEAMHPGEMAWDALNYGHERLCFDGQYYFDTDHPVELVDGSTTTYSNSFTGTGPAWYVTARSPLIKPILWQERKSGEVIIKDKPTDDNVFESNEILYGIHSRRAFGYTLPYLCFRSTETLNSANLNKVVTAMESLTREDGKPRGLKAARMYVPTTLRQAANQLVELPTLPGGGANPDYNLVDVKRSGYLLAA